MLNFDDEDEVYEEEEEEENFSEAMPWIIRVLKALTFSIFPTIFDFLSLWWSIFTSSFIWISLIFIFSILIIIFNSFFTSTFLFFLDIFVQLINNILNFRNLDGRILFVEIPQYVNLISEIISAFFIELKGYLCPTGAFTSCLGIPTLINLSKVFIQVITHLTNVTTTFILGIFLTIQDWICAVSILQEGAEQYYCLTAGSSLKLIVNKIIEHPTYWYLTDDIFSLVQQAAHGTFQALDFFFNVLLEVMVLIGLWVIVMISILTIYVLLGGLSFFNVLGSIIISVFFLAKPYRDPADSELFWGNGTYVEFPDLLDLGLPRIVDRFDELDPLSLLLPNETIDYYPPGLWTFNETQNFTRNEWINDWRIVLVEIAETFEDALSWLFSYLPVIVKRLDKIFCSLLNLDACLGNFYLCEFFFAPDSIFAVLDFLEFSNELLPFCNSIVEGFAEGKRCVCNACVDDTGEGFPCNTDLEERCCVIGGEYKSYDRWCVLDDQSTSYVSLWFRIFPPFFEPLANDPPVTSVCTKWGSILEATDGVRLTVGTAPIEFLYNANFHSWGNNESFPFMENVMDAFFGTQTRFDGTDLLALSALGYEPTPALMDTPGGKWIEDPYTYRSFLCKKLGIITPSWYECDLDAAPYTCCLPSGCGLNFVGFNLYDDILTFDGCSAFVYLTSICYARYSFDPNYHIQYTPTFRNYRNLGLIRKNLFCPDGSRLIKNLNLPVTTYRPYAMCILMQSWINEFRNYNVRHKIMDTMIDESVINGNNQYDTWYNPTGTYAEKVPEWYTADPRMILDFIKEGKVVELCEIFQLRASGIETIVECIDIWSNLSQIVFPGNLPRYIPSGSGYTLGVSHVCLDGDFGEFESNLNKFIFPGKPQFDNEFESTGHKNVYNFYREMFRRGLSFNDILSARQLCLSFIEPLAGIDVEFGDTKFSPGPEVFQYYDMITADPDDYLLDEIVIFYLNNLGDDVYPYSRTWECEPSGSENSALFNYEHLLTEHYLVVNNYQFNVELVLQVLVIDVWLSGLICDFVDEPGYTHLWDCDSDFYITFKNDLFSEHKLFQYNLLEFLFKELKDEYVIDDPGDFLWAAIRLATAANKETDDDYIQQVANMIRNTRALMSNTTYWHSIIENYWNTSLAVNILNFIDDCISWNLSKELCRAYGYALEYSKDIRLCLLDPFTYDARDCIKLFYGKYYNFRNGLNIYDRIDTYEFPGT